MPRSDPPAAQPVSSDDDNGDRIIDGLRYPREERKIDQMGFEVTKHSLHFRGKDWDIVLTQKREDLTNAFIAGASQATDEPVENIGGLRFVVNDSYLSVRFTVRHRAAIPVTEIQQKVAKYSWKEVKKLYVPREKKSRPERLKEKQETETTLGALHRQHTGAAQRNLSFYGRANVGPEGPQFEDEKDMDEEPVPVKKRNSLLMRSVSLM